MATISVEIPDELAERLTPVQGRLTEIIELGLGQLQRTEDPSLTPRQVIERIWTEAGLTKALHPIVETKASSHRERQAPLQTEGKAASQIIIEQRGNF